MDVAALSMGLSQMKHQQQATISVMKLALDSAQGQSGELTKMLESSTQFLEQSIEPHLGVEIDLYL